MLIVVLSDLRIPTSTASLPPQFAALLKQKSRIDKVLLLGDSITELNNKSKLILKLELGLVNEDKDEDGDEKEKEEGTSDELLDIISPIPNSVIKIDGLSIGCCSSLHVPRGDPLTLLSISRQLNVDILLVPPSGPIGKSAMGGTIGGINGGSEAYTLDDTLFVCPGSATGAFIPGNDNNNNDSDNKETRPPSFCLLETIPEGPDNTQAQCTLYIYTLDPNTNQVSIDKLSYTKK